MRPDNLVNVQARPSLGQRMLHVVCQGLL
jgi:hypothetical protein